jgi:hypothetical protein
MTAAHVHHILFKTGLGQKQKRLVAEGILILNEAGIDFTTKANLAWAPNKAGQHTIANLEEVLVELRKLRRMGALKQEYLDKLAELGDEAAGR